MRVDILGCHKNISTDVRAINVWFLSPESLVSCLDCGKLGFIIAPNLLTHTCLRVLLFHKRDIKNICLLMNAWLEFIGLRMWKLFMKFFFASAVFDVIFTERNQKGRKSIPSYWNKEWFEIKCTVMIVVSHERIEWQNLFKLD